MAQQIRTVAIIGCGVIGSSWACLCLSKGLKVFVSDPAAGSEQNLKHYLHETWPTVQAGVPLDEILANNFTFVDDAKEILPEADFVQENGPEHVETKQRLMAMLDEFTRPGVVIASSSSGLPSSKFIQQCRKDPSRVLIGHPFNPPHLIPLVEVVPHPNTSETTISTTLEFYKSLGKTPVLLNQEVPGFVINRLQAAINNESYSLVSRGVVSAKDLDAAVTSGPGLRWALSGPFVINALGGGGGPTGFAQRIERLGPSIRSWEEDLLAHRFDWTEESLSTLKKSVSEWLDTVDWSTSKSERDRILLQLLKLKSESASIT